MSESLHIETNPRPNCPVCNHKGSLIHRNLSDRLFKTPGTWTMVRCANTRCKTMWLDPTPKEEEIPKLYITYSTHSSPIYTPPTKNGLRAFLEHIRSAYLFTKYGYGNPPSLLKKILLPLAYIHPAWRDAQGVNLFYIPSKKGGLFLDVGCGGGNAMQTMQQKGWRTVGTDFDERAIANARSKGLEVHLGKLPDIAFPDEYADAILLSHVIEHVPDPESLLSECRRILAKKGVLVAVTPNANSLGHMLYGKNWRGLETPQHLQIFSVDSLKKLAHNAGFTHVQAFSSLQGALYILESSHQLKKHNTAELPTSTSLTKKLYKESLLFILGWFTVFFPKKGEIAVIVCTK